MSFAYHNKYGLIGKMHQHNVNAATKQHEIVTERRLSRACKHVNHYWFPINKQLIQKINEGLLEGRYDLDIDFLIAELKTDLSLILYAVRETLMVLKAHEKKVPANASLVTIFELAGLNTVKKILIDCENRVSTHDLEMINEEQALRLQEALISASTAETVAEDYNLDQELGYSCAIVRQLGHILISWNYAEIYKRCLNSVTPTQSLDQLLGNALGFSPKLLALALLTEWGLEGDLLAMLAEGKKPSSEDGKLQNLTKLCEIGEALARANDPEHYPTAAADWEKVKEDLAIVAGSKDIKAIQDKIKKNTESYTKLFPEMFQIIENVNPDTHIHDHNENVLLANNQFVKHCPPRLRKKLKNFYSILKPGEIIAGALTLLVKDIIPFAGFSGGYIFTYDPVLGHLLPRTKIGQNVELAMRTVEYNKDRPSSDSISTAFNCTSPIISSDENNTTSSITASLGNDNKIGVLYLETHKESLENTEYNLLLHFKAIRQAFNDCFQI